MRVLIECEVDVSKPTRVLIVENDPVVAQQFLDFFTNKGCLGRVCCPVETCFETSCDGFDLVLLSVGVDGYNLLQKLRQKRKLPVIVLAKPEQKHILLDCLKGGADDFLLKPVCLDELFARVESIFRRVDWSATRCDSCNRTLVAGELTLARNELKAIYEGKEIPLTPIQFRLLWVLVENRNEVLSKPYLYQVVLERAFSRYDRSLDMHLSRVRRKLASCGMMPERFSTIHGKGYRFA